MAVAERPTVRAEAKYVRTAPRKAQLVAEQIRGRPVPEARTILAFMTRDAARDVERVLASAVANAEANHGLVGDELYVSVATGTRHIQENARRAIDLRNEFGSLARYFWSYEPRQEDRPAIVDREHIVANPTTATSVRISKDLKKRGWTFVGPTTVYAFMQAMGLVNDHLEGCFCRAEVEAMRAALARP